MHIKHTYNISSNELLKSTMIYNNTYNHVYKHNIKYKQHQFMQFNIRTRYRTYKTIQDIIRHNISLAVLDENIQYEDSGFKTEKKAN
jgi:hypothetical protein